MGINVVNINEKFIKCHRCTRILGVVFTPNFRHKMFCESCGESEKYKRLSKKGGGK